MRNRYTKAPTVDVLPYRSLLHLNNRPKKLLPSVGQRRNMLSFARKNPGTTISVGWGIYRFGKSMVKDHEQDKINRGQRAKDAIQGYRNGEQVKTNSSVHERLRKLETAGERERDKTKIRELKEEIRRLKDEAKARKPAKKKKTSKDDKSDEGGAGGAGGQRTYTKVYTPKTGRKHFTFPEFGKKSSVVNVIITLLCIMATSYLSYECLVPFISTVFVHLELLLSVPKQIIFDLMLSIPIPEQEEFCGVNNVIACSPEKVTWLSSELINFDSGFWDHSPFRLQNNRDLIVVTLFLLIVSMVFSIFLALKAYYANVTMELLFGEEDKTPLFLLPLASAVAIFGALIITLLLSAWFNQTMGIGDLQNHLILSEKRVLDLESIVLTYDCQLSELRLTTYSQRTLDLSILQNAVELARLQETVDLSILKNGEELARLQETVDSLLTYQEEQKLRSLLTSLEKRLCTTLQVIGTDSQ